MRLAALASCLAATCACGEHKIDLTGIPAFENVTGACIELESTVALMSDERSGSFWFAKIPASAITPDLPVVRAGTRIVIKKIVAIRGFDGDYFFLNGELVLDDGRVIEADLEELFELWWIKENSRRFSSGIPDGAPKDTRPLPLVPGLAKVCSKESK